MAQHPGDGPPAGTTARYLELEVANDRVDLASGVLWSLGVVAVEELDGSEGTTLLRTTPDAGLTLDDLVTEVLAVIEPLAHRVVSVVDADWLDTWRAHAQPVAAGERTWITPSWRTGTDPAPDGRVTVRIDPGRSFGNGSHQSTRLALALVERILARPSGSGQSPAQDAQVRVLDVGCGSGVLSIAALLLGARTARAIDVDPGAVATTIANAADNGVADRVEVDDTALEGIERRYELVVANILAPVLVELAPDLVERVAPGGHLVVAGFLGDQEASVVGALERSAAGRGRHVEVAGRICEDDWSACSLRCT